MCEQDFNFNEEKFAEETEKNDNLTPEELIDEPIDDIDEAEELTDEEIADVLNFVRNHKPDYKAREKRAIKRSAKAVGVSFLVLYGLMWVINLAAIFIAKIFEPTYSGAVNLLSDPAILQVEQIIFSLLVFTLPFIIVFKLCDYRISNLINFEWPKGKNSFYLFLIGIGFCSFANIASSMAERVFDRAGISYEVDFGENPEGIFGFMLSLISTVIAPALVEEFACRGIVLGALKKHGHGFAIIASATLFGLMHSNFEQIPFAFLVGLVLGYITIKSGSIWIAVLVHAFNNMVSVVYTYFLSGLSSVSQNVSYTIFLIVCLLFGIFAITKISDDENIFKLEKETAISPLSVRLKSFFLSVPVIIYSSLCILQSFLYFK